MNFTDAVNDIEVASAAAIAAQPDLELFSKDHVAATQDVLKIVGASVVATNPGDAQIAAETQTATALAVTLAPFILKLGGGLITRIKALKASK